MTGKIVVLIVDDEEMMRSVLGKILEREGYVVHCAASVAEARVALHRTSVDIVISDIKMPDENGYALLAHVKREYPHIGVVLMTGYGDSYTVKDALLLGADEYLTKPFKSFEIAFVVERAYWRKMSENKRAVLDSP